MGIQLQVDAEVGVSKVLQLSTTSSIPFKLDIILNLLVVNTPITLAGYFQSCCKLDGTWRQC